ERNGNYLWFQVHSSAIFTLKSYAQALQLLGAMLPFTAIGIAHLYSKHHSKLLDPTRITKCMTKSWLCRLSKS
ncbi:hypothetical protein, partial [Nostoc sp. FACHB-888]|uniref:hypothetical protein n=1 Tax=Nostoc sp. FACHB-888 TaxID=2692842 RepID=UPI001A7F071A